MKACDPAPLIGLVPVPLSMRPQREECLDAFDRGLRVQVREG